MLSYIASYLVMGGTYGVAALALNLHWGFTGLMNFGLGAFYMLGAYTAAILTASPSPEHVGGFGLPFPIDLIGAAVVPGIVAFLISFPALRLRGGPFAIATLAIHETFFLIVHNEMWLTNGVWGIRNIPRPLYDLIPKYYDYLYLCITAIVLTVVYFAIKKTINSPWGRVLRAIRGDEKMTSMSGKNIWRYKMQSFVMGSMVMGVAGGVYVHYTGFVSPQVFTPLMSTFIVWLMIMMGGTGNNKGVIIGAFLVWAVWTGSEFLTDLLPAGMEARMGFIRMLLMGIILEVVILTRPQGILGRKKIISKLGVEKN